MKITEKKFSLKSDYKPAGDQPEAIDLLTKGIKQKKDPTKRHSTECFSFNNI